ncbi:MAG TPA: response regulator [Blastocatellia bacterium]|nr:response regulator [Blastocatellia bacterium]
MDYKILLADDSVTVQKIITLTFSDEGVDVIAVNNGAEAIDRLRRLRPALVMADISIPGRNGYEICEFVKTHPDMEGTPVILLVPAFEPFDEERARRIGADYHLTKPFQSIRMLISIVKNLIDRKPDDEFPVAGDSLTVVPEGRRSKYNTAEFNSRNAKIQELIRLSAQPASESGVENGTPLMFNPPHGNVRNLDSPLITNAPCEVEIIEDVKMDNILELDDVLPDLTSMNMRPMGSAVGPDAPAGAVYYETQGDMVIPQNVIDEIVNRVSAQLSAQLSERLSGEIARRIAPEVTEMVRRRLLAEPAPFRDSENLLDID